jgi:hypothetical protein
MVTLKLTTPISHGSEPIHELTFQPLKAKHMRSLSKDINLNEMLNLASTLTGVPPRTIDELSSEDTLRVIEVINGFFPNSQGIGAIASG